MPAMGGIEFATQILAIRRTRLRWRCSPVTPIRRMSKRRARPACWMCISKPGTIQQMEEVLKALFAKLSGDPKE